jgi:hypothetical protein
MAQDIFHPRAIELEIHITLSSGVDLMVPNKPSNHIHIRDLCIVGTGSMGIALTLECERLGREVLMLASGGSENQPEANG